MPRNFEDSPEGVPEDWIPRNQVIDMTGLTNSKLNWYQAKGYFTPRHKSGLNFYDPKEVKQFIDNPPKKVRANEDLQAEYATFQLGVIKEIVSLVKDPRERIDDIQFEIIERQKKRIEELEAKLDAARDSIEQAKDLTAERNLAVEQVKSEGRIKEIAMLRMVDTVGKLINGKPGVKLSPQQLEQLLIANDDGEEKFLTPDQEKQARQEIAEFKAKTNGKAVVAGVKETVEKTAEAMKHD